MQIVLLSGGSGQRLWPLSNSARSKQFLPLLERADGSMESMVQRVVRQVLEAGLTRDITIATNTSQLDIITKQLGDKVDVVTEPQRRDTFPAIALAACYLSLEKGCRDDETVVVMPCDPYTDDGYFRTIARMAGCLENGAADLVLMGISPTHPSTRFGYIVPEASDGDCLKVRRFTEKPDETTAVDLLSQHALWNGGVFAFKLGYMLGIVRKYVCGASFGEIRARYGEFPRISFDYEVAEKAQSVAVVPFAGSWKDLGTWNSLTGELRRSAIGNATLGPDCSNVHVINELPNPVFVDGISDAIVATCPDGILVCSKDRSEDIKNYVSGLSQRPMYEERRWGTYRVMDETVFPDKCHSLVKRITMMAGKNSSYHRHLERTETWTFVDGSGFVVLDGAVQEVHAGDTVVVPAGRLHAVKAVRDLTFIEVQNGSRLVDEDVDRLSWDWEWDQ